MARANSKQIISDLYGLLLDINLHRTDEQVLEELGRNPDPSLNKHLLKIRQLQIRCQAEANKVRYKEAFDQLLKLKEKGVDELRKLILPQEEFQLMPLFRKFEELTPKDELSLLEDQELLILIERLNSKINEDPQH